VEVGSIDVGVAMPGMPGFGVLEAREIDGELKLVVETDQVLVGCTGCGVRAVSGRSTRLAVAQAAWRCHEPLCARST
jgi:hypothetical protein